MLVTFRTDAYANITMLGDVALTMIRLMGHSTAVPGAILADDVPQALSNLKRAIEDRPAPENSATQTPANPDDDEDEEPQVSLANHAYPLLQLLSAAAKDKSDVMWDKS